MVNKCIVKITNLCNNNCLFCHSALIEKKEESLINVKNKIRDAMKKGASQILLSGGEPTIHTKLDEIILYLSENNASFGFISNGRVFSCESYAEQVIKKGASFFYISLHSFLDDTHNKLTQIDSWQQTVKGIKNLLRFGGDEIIIKTNLVMTKFNVSEIKDYILYMIDLGVKNIKISFPEFKGNVVLDSTIVPSVMDAFEAIRKAVDDIGIMKFKSKNITLFYDGFPDCFFESYPFMKKDTLRTNGITHLTEIFEKDFYETSEGNKVRGKCCGSCTKCLGFYDDYKDEFSSIVRMLRCGDNVE